VRVRRRERLLDLLELHGLDAIVLRRPANFAWYTGGADSRVDHVSPDGVADLVVTRDGEHVVTSTIEAPRFRAEQTPELDVVEYAWEDGSEQMLRVLTGGGLVGADVDLPGARDVAAEVAGLRRTLDPDAIERLREVGRDTVDALAEAAEAVVPGVGELELAAEIASACRRRGLSSPVLLAAADERIARHRHALPFGATVERRAMLVVSAERGGLYANLTRFVELDEPDPQLARRIAAVGDILERMRVEATRPGETLADAFAACRGFYRDAGFPDEIRLHHQGGLTGYASREVIATPKTGHVIAVGQAFAWNPSITGAKAEETFVLTESGPEIVAGAVRVLA
jgi:Xaa-Pro dipeptidase